MNLSYATFAIRIRAALIDGLIVLLIFVALPCVFSDVFDGPNNARVFILWSPILLLEPLLVAYWGRTIGQFIHGIEVTSVGTSGKLSLVDSFIRYYSKVFLGVFSMLYILFSAQKQAIHDKIAQTVVVVSGSGETEDSISDLDSDYIYPSAFRRFTIFIGWYLFSMFSSALLLLVLVTIVTGSFDSWPKWADQLSSLIEIILLVGLAMLAGEGYLPGARRRRKSEQ